MSLTQKTYTGRIVDHYLLKTKGGKPQAVIVFKFKDDDGNDAVKSWFGSFEGGAQPITVETLVKCGFEGTSVTELHRVDADAPFVLNTERDLEVVLKNDTYNGKTTLKLKYINVPGEVGFAKRIEVGEVKSLTLGLDIRADLLVARKAVSKPVANGDTVAGEDFDF